MFDKKLIKVRSFSLRFFLNFAAQETGSKNNIGIGIMVDLFIRLQDQKQYYQSFKVQFYSDKVQSRNRATDPVLIVFKF